MSVLIKGLTKEKVESCFRFAKDGWCIFNMPEIIEVPPHGRLGDLDELYIHLNEWYLTNNPAFTKEEALCIRTMLLGIVEAPTIIPAEEDEI